MQVCRTIEEFRAVRQRLVGSIGLVPTMGYLHDGHLSLVRLSQAQNDHTVATIFVNPTQFNSTEDLEKYPRDEVHDLAMLDSIDVVLIPRASEMYPTDFQTHITVENVSQGLEGQHRPGHFEGVATVVAKLFNIVQPTRAYFGQKDAQQVAVIRQMVADLNFPIDVVVGDIMREIDGVAMSSRNARLDTAEREAAVVLHKSLSGAQRAFHSGERDPQRLRELMLAALAQEPRAKVEYVSVADTKTLKELQNPIQKAALLSMAVYIGAVRLIDNMVVEHDG